MKKIFVIEDDPDVTGVIQGIFETHGYEGSFFTNGEAAIPEIEKKFPDLVIMDIMMPGMSGFEVCQYLKRSGKTHNIPLIAITGYDSKDNRQKIFASGIDDYLAKPFDTKTLIRKIKALLGE